MQGLSKAFYLLRVWR